MFFILAFWTGLVLIVAPLWFSRWISKKWKMSKAIFWKAGLFHLIAAIIYFGVAGNLSSAIPQFATIHPFLRAILEGMVAGLFLELGRFVVLDRVMKKIRNFREGLYFGLGWSGIYAFLIGILSILNSLGMYYLINTADIAPQFPEATTQQIQILEDAKKEALVLEQENPLLAITPLIEHAGFLMMDIAMTLLILSGIRQGKNRYIWGAVLLRALFTALSFYLMPLGWLWSEAVIVIFAGIALGLIQSLRKMLV